MPLHSMNRKSYNSSIATQPWYRVTSFDVTRVRVTEETAKCVWVVISPTVSRCELKRKEGQCFFRTFAEVKAHLAERTEAILDANRKQQAALAEAATRLQRRLAAIPLMDEVNVQSEPLGYAITEDQL